MKEIWKDVIGYEGYYQVSNLGQIRSVDRIIDKGDIQQPRKGRIKKQLLNPDGYLTVKLSKDGKDRRVFVHDIVAQAFIKYNTYDQGIEVNHKDTNRTNNTVDNLEWVSHRDNINYSVGLGHYKHFGELNPNFGNDTLRNKYAANPKLALEKQSRPGKQNGRCVPIIAKDIENNTVLKFDYLHEAADYFINNGYYDRPINSNSLSNKLKRLLTQNKPYFGFKLSYA